MSTELWGLALEIVLRPWKIALTAVHDYIRRGSVRSYFLPWEPFSLAIRTKCFMMQLSFYDVLCGYIGNGSIAKLANSMHVVVLQGFEETYWEPQNCWKFCIIVVACDFEDRKKRVCCFCRAGGGGGEWGWSGGTVQNVLHAFCQQFQREPKQGHQLAWKCSKAWNYFHL